MSDTNSAETCYIIHDLYDEIARLAQSSVSDLPEYVISNWRGCGEHSRVDVIRRATSTDKVNGHIAFTLKFDGTNWGPESTDRFGEPTATEDKVRYNVWDQAAKMMVRHHPQGFEAKGKT